MSALTATPLDPFVLVRPFDEGISPRTLQGARPVSTTPQPTPPAPTSPTTVTAPALAPYEKGTAEEEGRFHNYIGHQIPWYIRLLWLIFWVASAWYVMRLLLPALNSELLSPP